ncbi:MAG: hypothetical protein AAB343_02575 [Patescibacteria group bacterium]
MKVTKCKVFAGSGSLNYDLAREKVCLFINEIGQSLADIKIIETVAANGALHIAVYYPEEITD